MKQSFLLISFFFLLSTCSLFAQKLKSTTNEDSTFTFVREERYDLLLNKQKEQNLAKQTMAGYRIQVYFGGNRQKASEVKSEFSSKYPDVPTYLTYQQPNYKIRVGDFLNRFEAQKFMKQLDGLYPTLFIVPDEVKLPPLK